MNKLFVFAGAAVGLGILANSAKAAPSGQANIVATDMTTDKTSCQGSCTVNGSVTWENQGDTAGSFTPQISANNVSEAIGAVKTMQPGEVYTKTFSKAISAQTAFCPVPPFAGE